MATNGFDRAFATEQIRRIILAYPELVDRGNFEGVGRLLAGVQFGGGSGRNAEIVPVEQLEARSAEQVTDMYRSAVLVYEDGLPHTKHLITNIDVWFSDDLTTAETRSYYTVIQRRPDFPLQIVIAGRYEDSFESSANGWKLKIRREYSDLVGDLSHHVSPEVMLSLSHGS